MSAEPRRTSRRALRQIALLTVTLVVLYFLVLPQLARGRENADLIAEGNPWLLVVALALQLSSLLAYTLMTRSVLPAEPHISLFTLLRIQVATKALAHVVPGGQAASSTLGFRLLTQAGVPAPATGFALATVGLGSAVVLNVIVWVALMISIPVNGIQPVYTAAAITGGVLLAGSATLVVLMMKGRSLADRVVRVVVRPIPFVQEDAASRFFHHTADRLHELAARPDLIRRGVVWAAANWLLDAASLWMVLAAIGYQVHPVDLIVAFGVAQVLAAVPITPGGLGLVEAVLPGLLAALTGVPVASALVAVLVWRFLQFWLPLPLGALSYVSLRIGRRRHLAERVAVLASDADGSLTERRDR